MYCRLEVEVYAVDVCGRSVDCSWADEMESRSTTAGLMTWYQPDTLGHPQQGLRASVRWFDILKQSIHHDVECWSFRNDQSCTWSAKVHSMLQLTAPTAVVQIVV